jgi:hypothetical protein
MFELPSTLDITLRPTAAWQAIRTVKPRWTRSLLGHALPLALLPATAWPVGQSASGSAAVFSFASTLVFSLASVVLFALGVYVLSSFFEAERDWDRSMAVAAYASTPVLLCGALLVIPLLVIASLAGFVHFLVLAHLGLQRVLGCRADDAAGFTAASCLFAAVASMVLGGLCSAAGLI